MELVLPLLVVAAIVITIVQVVRQVRLVTVRDYERGLRFQRGKLAGLVDPGVHWTFARFSEIQPLDLRPTTTPVEGQEVLTSDGVAAKVSLVARYAVGDPVAAITRDAAYSRTVYLWLQLALRDAIARRTLDEAIAGRTAMGAEIREAVAGRIAELGVDLLDVDVRDVMLPGELKRAYSGVVAARKDGEAALERARSETATLRNLANAGHAMADNPGLLQLRILQELGASSGNTVVFGAPDAGRVPHGTTADAPVPGAGAATGGATPAARRGRPGTSG